MKKQVSSMLCALALAACSTGTPSPETPQAASPTPGYGTPESAWSAPGSTARADDVDRSMSRSNVPATLQGSSEPPPSAQGTGEEGFVVPADPAAGASTAAAPGGASAGSTEPVAVRPDADNTRVNERDRDPARKTPMDQGNNMSDLEITQKIRQAVMGDTALSFTAKNVKIITAGGKVTLRGPVKSADERTRIEVAARRIAGDVNVVNEIEIKN